MIGIEQFLQSGINVFDGITRFAPVTALDTKTTRSVQQTMHSQRIAAVEQQVVLSMPDLMSGANGVGHIERCSCVLAVFDITPVQDEILINDRYANILLFFMRTNWI